MTDTLKRKHQEKSYFSTLEVIGGLQVQRVFLLTAIYLKGKPMYFYYDEVCRLWLNAKGQVAVTSRLRAMGYYRDSFSFASPIELRNMSDVHLVISDAYICPYYSVLPELRRNGMKGKLSDCHPFELMKALLADHRMETMMKARDYKAVEYFIYRDGDIEISVLDSLEAYKEEGNKMKHCVFQCEYYAKTDSVILSAHDHLGNRIETVEFSLSQGKVVQSRGVCNSNTEYHDRIIRLVNENAYRFMEARRASA